MIRNNLFYILDKNKNPQPFIDVVEWAKWWEVADRSIGFFIIGNIIISTVFIGINIGDDMLYETMVIDSKPYIIKRYKTKEEAEKGHEETIEQYSR